MAAIVKGLCMEGLWRGWHFAMIGMKKLQDIFKLYYYPMVLCALLTFKNFQLVLLIQMP